MGEEVVPPGSVVLLGRLYPAPRPPGWCRGDPSWPLRPPEGLGAMADEGAALTVQLTVPPACRGSRHPQAGQCQRVWMAGSWPGPPVRHPGIWELSVCLRTVSWDLLRASRHGRHWGQQWTADGPGCGSFVEAAEGTGGSISHGKVCVPSCAPGLLHVLCAHSHLQSW